ncbi:MAG: hypothetical protein IPI35_28540 [Deltaproteobacteria bacterium]|nr:hypothetical protein [Deltaproteobacteria bacterium]
MKASSPALFSFSTPVEVLVFGPELRRLRRTPPRSFDAWRVSRACAT